jgi:rubrerythrin
MELKGSKTEKNLQEAFAGESMARNKYTYFAGRAKKDGFEQISAVFTETADNEKEHAKIWYKWLNGGEVAGTADNLRAAAGGENGEWSQMYRRMAAEARQEGFTEIAAQFEKIGGIEKEHEARYLKLLANLEKKQVFENAKAQTWICRNCGFSLSAKNAPIACPVCSHPQAYFEIKSTNY